MSLPPERSLLRARRRGACAAGRGGEHCEHTLCPRKARDLEKKDSKKILAYYRARSSGNSTFDEASILNDMPPSLAGDKASPVHTMAIAHQVTWFARESPNDSNLV